MPNSITGRGARPAVPSPNAPERPVEVNTTPAEPAIRPGSAVIDEIERTRPTTPAVLPPGLTHTTTIGRSALDVRLDANGGEVGLGTPGGARGTVGVDRDGVLVTGGVVRDRDNGRDSLDGRIRVTPDGTTDVHIATDHVRRDDGGTTTVTTTVDVGDARGIRAATGIAIARRGTDGVWRTFDGRGEFAITATGANGSATVRHVVDFDGRSRTLDGSVRGRVDAGGVEGRGRVAVTTRDERGTHTVDANGVVATNGLSADVGRTTTGPSGDSNLRADGRLNVDGGAVTVTGSRTNRRDDGSTTNVGGTVNTVVDARGVSLDANGTRTVTDADGGRRSISALVRVDPEGRVIGDGRAEITVVEDGVQTTVGGTVGVDVAADGTVRRTEVGFDAERRDGTTRDRIHGRLTTNIVDGQTIFDTTVGFEHDEATDDGSIAIRAGLEAHVDADGARSRGTLHRTRTRGDARSVVEISSDGTDLVASGTEVTTRDGNRRTIGANGTLSIDGVVGRMDFDTIDADGSRRAVNGNVNLDGETGRVVLGAGGRRETDRLAIAADGSLDVSTAGVTARGTGTITSVRANGSSTYRAGVELTSADDTTPKLGVGVGYDDRVIDGHVETTVGVDLQVREDSVVLGAGRAVHDRESGNSLGVDGRIDVVNGRGGLRATSTRVDGERRTDRSATVDAGADHVRASVRRDVDGPDGHRGNAVGIEVGEHISAVHGVRTRRIGADSHTTDGRLAFTDGGVDLSVAHRHGFVSRGRMVSVGIAVGGSTALRVRDEGAVTGGPLNGLRRVVTESASGREAGVGGGVRLGIAHVGGGGQTRRDHDVAWVTHLDESAAGAAVAQPSRVTVPDLDRPEDLRVGDAVTVRTSGEVECSLDVSVLGIGARGRTTVGGSFTFVVEKIAADRVRVTLTPAQIASLAVEGRAIVLRASIEASKSASLAQTFDFDLTTTAGREAYARALDGVMPPVDVDVGDMDAADQASLIERLNDTLPTGVRATRAVSEETRRLTTSVGVSWAFLNVGRDTHTIRTERNVLEADRVRTELETRRESVRRTWFSGAESKGAFSAISHVTTRDPQGVATTEFRAITLGARVADTEVEGRDLDKMLATLRDTLGVPISAEAHRGTGDSRTIDVQLVVDAQALGGLPQRAIDGLEDAARASKASSEATKELTRRLLRSPAAADRAEAIERYVSEEGLKGLGALVRAFRQIEVEIHANETGDEQRIADAEAAISRHTGPIAAGDAATFIARFTDLHTHQRFITTAKSAVAADPFLSDERRRVLLDRIDAADLALDTLLDVSSWSSWQKMKAVSTITLGATVATNTVATAAVRYLNHGEPET